MPAVERFFDTNVLLYLLSADAARAGRAEDELAGGGAVSVQVLNEFAAVATRKLGMSIGEVRDVLAVIRALCSVAGLSVQTHDRGLEIAARYRLPVFDAMIVAAALETGCTVLLSEDFQHGQRFADRLRVVNPFR